MKYCLFILLFFLDQADVPYKAEDEFKLSVNLKFKEKKGGFDSNTYSTNGEALDKDKGQLPFIEIDVSQLKIREDEVKVIIEDSNGKRIMNKKTSPVPELHFPMGFVNELKNQEGTHEIYIYFMSQEKKQLRKIVCAVLKDGTFQVNGQWRGKF